MSSWEEIAKEVRGTKGLAARLRKRIPNPAKLAAEAQKRILGDPPQKVICDGNLNKILCNLFDIEYQIYLEFERKAFDDIVDIALGLDNGSHIRQTVEESLQIVQGGSLSPNEVLKQISKNLLPIHKAVAESFAQSRKNRAGGSAQYHVEFVLNQLGYAGKYEKARKLNGTVDFLFPNLKTWEQDRRRCTILSVKRSLRERYKQVFEELAITRGLTVYLMVTETEKEAEKDITDKKVGTLNSQNIYLVVRDEIKAERFSKSANVRGFTEFFCKDLPSLSSRWEVD